MIDTSPANEPAFVLKSPMRGLSVVIFAVMSVGAFLTLVLRDHGWFDRCWLTFGTVMFGFLAWRSSRAVIRCDPTSVTSTDINVGMFRPRRIDWSQLERFEERGWRGIGARLRTGRWVPLLYYATVGDVSQEMATDLLEQQRKKYQVDGQRQAGQAN